VPPNQAAESLLLLLQIDTGPLAGVVHGKGPIRVSPDEK
jgi:hypothetical protein